MYKLTDAAYVAQVRNFRSTIANTVTYLRALGEADANPVMQMLLDSMGAVDTIQHNCDACGGLGSCDIERGGSWVSCVACDGTGVREDDEEDETLDEEGDGES